MVNDDLISRAAAFEAVYENPYITAVEMIKKVPGLDAAPVVHARWIKEPDRENRWHCGNCGFVEGIVSRFYNYCPNCGAKMDGERRNDHAPD